MGKEHLGELEELIMTVPQIVTLNMLNTLLYLYRFHRIGQGSLNGLKPYTKDGDRNY